MGSVHGPSVARHPSPFKRAFKHHPYPFLSSSSSSSLSSATTSSTTATTATTIQTINPITNPTTSVIQSVQPHHRDHSSSVRHPSTSHAPTASATTNPHSHPPATGSSISTNPSASNNPSSSSTTTMPNQPDPFYGHEDNAKICARFVTFVFACPDIPAAPSSSLSLTTSSTNSSSSSSPPNPPPPLANFIAYALHRTRLHSSVTYTALFLLQRLKSRFPAARGSSGHRLFLSAFMLASKVVCDDTYSNKSWAVVGQGMFALREINQMEREMCAYLEWQLNVLPEPLKGFEALVRFVFAKSGPYSEGVSKKLAQCVAAGVASPSKEKEKDELVVQQLPTPTETGHPFSLRRNDSVTSNGPVIPVIPGVTSHIHDKRIMNSASSTAAVIASPVVMAGVSESPATAKGQGKPGHGRPYYPSPPTTPPSPSPLSSNSSVDGNAGSTIAVTNVNKVVLVHPTASRTNSNASSTSSLVSVSSTGSAGSLASSSSTLTSPASDASLETPPQSLVAYAGPGIVQPSTVSIHNPMQHSHTAYNHPYATGGHNQMSIASLTSSGSSTVVGDAHSIRGHGNGKDVGVKGLAVLAPRSMSSFMSPGLSPSPTMLGGEVEEKDREREIRKYYRDPIVGEKGNYHHHRQQQPRQDIHVGMVQVHMPMMEQVNRDREVRERERERASLGRANSFSASVRSKESQGQYQPQQRESRSSGRRLGGHTRGSSYSTSSFESGVGGVAVAYDAQPRHYRVGSSSPVPPTSSTTSTSAVQNTNANESENDRAHALSSFASSVSSASASTLADLSLSTSSVGGGEGTGAGARGLEAQTQGYRYRSTRPAGAAAFVKTYTVECVW